MAYAILSSMSPQSLNPRTEALLRLIVDSYVTTGEAVGSRTLSADLARLMGLELSPATIRNILADMEDMGLLYAPHISAGRLPTEAGLQLFVDRLMEVSTLDPEYRAEIEQHLPKEQTLVPQALEKISTALSSLSQCAGLVIAPKKDRPFRQVEFMLLQQGQALAVWVGEDGSVENRLLDVDPRITPSDLQKASNYLTHHLHGRTLEVAKISVAADIAARRAALDELTQELVQQGLALPSGEEGLFIVRGQSHLLNDSQNLEEIRRLFETLEQRETLLRLLAQTEQASGVQIFIGAQNALFNHAGCAMIVAPYRNKNQHLIGAIGLIGPSRMNYGRLIPMVDYTAKILSGALQ